MASRSLSHIASQLCSQTHREVSVKPAVSGDLSPASVVRGRWESRRRLRQRPAAGRTNNTAQSERCGSHKYTHTCMTHAERQAPCVKATVSRRRPVRGVDLTSDMHTVRQQDCIAHCPLPHTPPPAPASQSLPRGYGSQKPRLGRTQLSPDVARASSLMTLPDPRSGTERGSGNKPSTSLQTPAPGRAGQTFEQRLPSPASQSLSESPTS